MLCPLGRFVPWDVLSLGRFVPWNVLSLGPHVLGRFDPWDVLSVNFYLVNIFAVNSQKTTFYKVIYIQHKAYEIYHASERLKVICYI